MNNLLKYKINAAFSAVAFFVLSLCSFPETSFAQNCNGLISGKVTDQHHQVLPGVAVQLSGKSSFEYITDTSGKFTFLHLCPGDYTLTFKSIGFTTFEKEIQVNGKSDPVNIALKADAQQLSDVDVTAQSSQPISTVSHQTLTDQDLMKSQGKTLGQMLEQIPGVSAMQSGPSLSKPVIHGLTGNRVLILNNGVRQEGQQWGDDHAPELDPNDAGSITVVKGASSVRYGSDAIAGVVLMNPLPLPDTDGISGNVGISGASNGREGSVDGDLEGAFKGDKDGLFSWRVQGTLKRAGNFRTPDYFLDNTGLEEGDYSGQIKYQYRKLSISASYSSYNSKIGIFSGSEVADALGLNEAYLNRSHPNTPDYFTYSIGHGRQQINHDIVKVDAGYTFSNKGNLKLTYSRQTDLRQEYSPAITETLPDDWFNLITHSVDLIYTEPYKDGFFGSFGASGNIKNNRYQGLDARPLIPNYSEAGGGIFAIEHYTTGQWLFESGLRYDYLHRKVQLFDPQDAAGRPGDAVFQNVTGTVGITYHLNNQFDINGNWGMGWRAPGVEEMYIDGVHSAAAQFATGDSALKIERSYNTSLSLNYKSEKLKISANLYDNEINNFIYLVPVGIKKVDSNVYHAYQYTQDNVRLLGADISADWAILPVLSFDSKTSLLRATNKTQGGGLLNMPPAKFQNGLTFHVPHLGKMEQPYFTLQNTSVLKQNYILSAQEALLPPPPPGYSLWNVNLGGSFQLGKKTLDLNFSVDNLTNKVYSDYMNQFRYFAYNMGINFALRAKISF